MSSQFRPIQIPPGVVSTATKRMQSSNWAASNNVRWIETKLTPIGGQVQYAYSMPFASTCKLIHGWYDLSGVYHIAYLCEANLYVDTGGTLTEVSPIPPITAPTIAGQGGYGDDVYCNLTSGTDLYGTPRTLKMIAAMDQVPDAYSLDNFGAILYAMTSADGRLLRWDPGAGTGLLASANAILPFTTASPTIYLGSHLPSTVVAGTSVYDVQAAQTIGAVASFAPHPVATTAQAAWRANAMGVIVPSGLAGLGAGLDVFDNTTGQDLGILATYGPVSSSLAAGQAFVSGTYAIMMSAANPGWVVPGLSVTDTTTSTLLGTVQTYGVSNPNVSANGSWLAGATVIPVNLATFWGICPGMTVQDLDWGVSLGVVSAVAASSVTMSAPLTTGSRGASDRLNFSSGTTSVLTFTSQVSSSSSGSADTLQFSSGANSVLALQAPIVTASSGTSDSITVSGGDVVTLSANAAYASSGSTDTLQFGTSANRATVQQPATGRGPVPTGRCFVVTPERFIMIFGSQNDGTGGTNGSTRRFAWCDQENPGAWDYSSVTSQAGFLDIEPASPILCADATRTGVLFFTGKKAYRSRFLGLPYIYNYEELADNCTPWSCQSMATTSSMVLWFSQQGCFSFDGTSILPVQCMVRPWIDDDIDLLAVRERAFAVHVENFNEFWWFFPTDDCPPETCDRAVVYNYKEGWWSQAYMIRSAGITAAYNVHTIMADRTVAFQHEVTGSTSDEAVSGMPYANADLPWVETFNLNIVKGGRLVTVKQLLPDISAPDIDDPDLVDAAIGSLRYSLFYRNSRSFGDPERQTPLMSVRANGYVDMRTTGRDIRLRIETAPGSLVYPFTIGQHQIDVVVRGDR